MTQWPKDAVTEEIEINNPWHGWKKIKNVQTGSRRYVSPGGVIISANEWNRVKKDYYGRPYMPENELNPVGASAEHPEAQTPPAASQVTAGDQSQSYQEQSQPKKPEFYSSNGSKVKQEKSRLEEVSDILPEPEKPSTAKRGKKHSQADVAKGIAVAYSVGTGAVAKGLGWSTGLNLEVLEVTNKEAQALGAAWALFLDEHGWLDAALPSMLSDNSVLVVLLKVHFDYAMRIGPAVSELTQILRLKRQMMQQQMRQQQADGYILG